jgi:hypothetical protein
VCPEPSASSSGLSSTTSTACGLLQAFLDSSPKPEADSADAVRTSTAAAQTSMKARQNLAMKRSDDALKSAEHAVRLEPTNHGYWRGVGTRWIKVPWSASTIAALAFEKRFADQARASTTLKGTDAHAHLYEYGMHLYRRHRETGYQPCAQWSLKHAALMNNTQFPLYQAGVRYLDRMVARGYVVLSCEHAACHGDLPFAGTWDCILGKLQSEGWDLLIVKRQTPSKRGCICYCFLARRVLFLIQHTL